MNKLKIAHHNIRSINDKIQELKLFIQINKPDIITFNETVKITPKTKIYGYNLTQPINNTGQGVAILYKYNINIQELPPITTNEPTNNLQHSILITTVQTKDTINIPTTPNRYETSTDLNTEINSNQNIPNETEYI